MANPRDLEPFLRAWPYREDRNIRVVRLTGDRQVLQVRLPLGLEQYELNGRPDGRRPHGRESYLAYYLSRRSRARRAGASTGFCLRREDCRHLFEEATLYYCRYVHLFRIQDWKRAIRDTSHNLALFDLVRDYAVEEDDRSYLEPWRPFVLRVRAIAWALWALKRRRHDEALKALRQGVELIRALPPCEADSFEEERDRSIEVLRSLAAQVIKSRPPSREEKLEQALRVAVEQERFEEAARLRDQLRALREQETSHPSKG